MKTRAFRFVAFLAVAGTSVLGACRVAPAPPPAYGPAAGAPPPAGPASPPAEARYEDGTWRPGGDLRTFDLPQGGPEACATACEKEPGCYAYSYTKPDYASHGVGQCALKHNVPTASKSACCVSGVIRPWP